MNEVPLGARPKELTFVTDSLTWNRFHGSKFYGCKSSTGDLGHKHFVAVLGDVRKELIVRSGASWENEDISQRGEGGQCIDCIPQCSGESKLTF